MNQISKELRREIENTEFMNEVVGELQDIQGMMENEELIARLGKVIGMLYHD